MSAIGSDVSGGGVRFALAADLGGFATDEGNATLSIVFLDGGSSPIGLSVTIGPVTAADRGSATGFRNRSTTGVVPSATRAIQVDITITRVSNAYNDGYADNLSLVLSSGSPTPAPTLTPTPKQAPCVGDCGGAGRVAVNDLISLVNIALGTAAPSACPHGIPVGANVDISLLVRAVNNALSGCR